MKVAIIEGTPAEICDVLQAMRLDFDAVIARDSDQKLIANRGAPAQILNAVCRVLDVHERTLLGPSRQREIAYARHVAIHLLRRDGGLGVMEVGRLMRRDHSTVLMADEKIAIELRTRPETLRDVELCRAQIIIASKEAAA